MSIQLTYMTVFHMHPEFSDHKDDGDTTSDTGMAQDEIPVHPRKRKLRAKTEAQSREQAENREVVLEKPPNPYELYLNLRRQVLCFILLLFFISITLDPVFE